jgi:hypothetical protein
MPACDGEDKSQKREEGADHGREFASHSAWSFTGNGSASQDQAFSRS